MLCNQYNIDSLRSREDLYTQATREGKPIGAYYKTNNREVGREYFTLGELKHVPWTSIYDSLDTLMLFHPSWTCTFCGRATYSKCPTCQRVICETCKKSKRRPYNRCMECEVMY